MKICLVTGGSRGIGAAVVRRLAVAGHFVYINYRQDDVAAQALADDLLAEGKQVELARADVASRDEVRQVFQSIRAGHGRLDVLVHSAAPPLVPKALSKLDWSADVMPQIETGCHGFLNCVQEATPLLPAGGRIVVLLTEALFHKPPVQMGAYLAAKGALLGLARAAASEAAPHQVRVNCVLPGLIETPMLLQLDPKAPLQVIRDMLGKGVPMGHIGTAEELAEMACFLLSDRASHITAQAIAVDGGILGTHSTR